MTTADVEPLTILPVRMLSEYAYCARLFHLMYVEGLWADNAYTIEGTDVHRRVDRIEQVLPDVLERDDSEDSAGNKKRDDADEPPVISRSVPLVSEQLRLSGKLDLVATDGPVAVPVETKRGTVPNNADRSYEPERVQLMAQGLLLREHGYTCDSGVLYYAGSRTRVTIAFTEQLEMRTRELLTRALHAAESNTIPPPLDDSAKCNGCSLNGICLPDETSALGSDRLKKHLSDAPAAKTPRRLYPVREYATPLYVQDHGAVVGKNGATLVVRKSGVDLSRVAIKDISQLVLCGNVMVTSQAFQLLCERNVPIVHSSMGHWFYGITFGNGLRNSFDKAAQFRAAEQPDLCLAFAKGLVEAKAQNMRTMLRRNGERQEQPLEDLARLIKRVRDVTDINALLGLEGAMASVYFKNFSSMIRSPFVHTAWDFTSRNRRPPRDPINAMISFCYAMLTKEFTIALISEGLEPWWGFYHKPRHGKPALALDMMEPYRPLIADSAVITAINTGMVRDTDFVRSRAGCMLKDTGRKALLRAFEARLDQVITHPIFGYRTSWRSALRVQCRLFSRWLRKDIAEFLHITTR